MNIVRHTAAALMLGLASLGAHAVDTTPATTPTVYGFEGLQVPFYSAGFIPDGYAGATWSGWILRRRDELQYTGLNGGSGAILALGTVSAPEISFAAPVVFDGIFGYYPRSQLSYDLFLGGQLVGSSITGPTGGGYLGTRYTGAVDRVVFHGVASGFSVDNMGITPAPLVAAPVPEPATWALMLAGVSAVGLWRRRGQVRT